MEVQRDRIESLLEEAVRWLRLLAAPTVRSWVEPTLTTSEERKVYQASTGGSMKEVGRAAGVSHQTVANYWRKWGSANPPILEETSTKGRYRRLYDLSELNVAVEVAP